MRDAVHTFDRVVGGWVSALPSWLKWPMEFFTLIGQPPFTVGAAMLVLGYGLALNKDIYEDAGLLAIATIAITSILKFILRRHRPRNAYADNMWIKTFSFPSGHAAGALVSYLMLALIVSNRWPEFTVAAWTIAVISCLLIAISRVYLGAHYASDIIGGWIVGGLGLLAIIVTIRP